MKCPECGATFRRLAIDKKKGLLSSFAGLGRYCPCCGVQLQNGPTKPLHGLLAATSVFALFFGIRLQAPAWAFATLLITCIVVGLFVISRRPLVAGKGRIDGSDQSPAP